MGFGGTGDEADGGRDAVDQIDIIVRRQQILCRIKGLGAIEICVWAHDDLDAWKLFDNAQEAVSALIGATSFGSFCLT